MSDQNVALACRDSLKRRVTVWLVDVLHLKADNFRLGNIIFDLEIFPGLDCPEELLRDAAGSRPTRPTNGLVASWTKSGMKD